jgi:hypothetical protein
MTLLTKVESALSALRAALEEDQANTAATLGNMQGALLAAVSDRDTAKSELAAIANAIAAYKTPAAAPAPEPIAAPVSAPAVDPLADVLAPEAPAAAPAPAPVAAAPDVAPAVLTKSGVPLVVKGQESSS